MPKHPKEGQLEHSYLAERKQARAGRMPCKTIIGGSIPPRASNFLSTFSHPLPLLLSWNPQAPFPLPSPLQFASKS
jgi:hypothetical protein